MRYENGNKLKVGNWWIFLGFLATDFGTALIHFVAIFIIDGNLIAAPGSSYSIFFYLVIPISIAIGVCFLLRKKARNSNLSTNN